MDGPEVVKTQRAPSLGALARSEHQPLGVHVDIGGLPSGHTPGKRLTMAGMGHCQGRLCREQVRRDWPKWFSPTNRVLG